MNCINNQSDFHYRVAVNSDIDDLIRLRILLFNNPNAHYSPSSPEEGELWKNKYRMWLEHIMSQQTNNIKIYVVSNIKEQIIACAIGIIDQRAPTIATLNGLQGWIQSLVVDPSWRNNNIATILITKLSQWFQSQEVDQIVLQTTAMAQSLYTKLNFVDSGETLLMKKLSRVVI